MRFTDTESHFMSEASVYRPLKAHDLIASPAFIVMKAADAFKDKTTAPNQLWQTDFAYLKVCLAWALDWRWKSFAGRVGSNREPEATARRVCRRETPMTLAPRGRVGKKPEANRSTERK